MPNDHTSPSERAESVGRALSRRRFLAGSAAIAGSAVVAACSSTSGSSQTTAPASVPNDPATTAPAPTTAAPTTAAPTSAGPATVVATAAPMTGAPIPELHPSVNAYLAGNFAPVTDELTADSLTIRGTLPAALDGHYLRNGPNPFGIGDPAFHSWFTGDGMVHGVELRGGAALSYRNRYVRTSTASARLGDAAVSGPPQPGFDGSNTNVVTYRGSILSLTEGALPYALDRELNTLERVGFGGGLTHGLSAHCKYDPVAQELHNVSYRIGEAPFAVWQVIGPDGTLTRSVPIDIAVTGMWHTFSITERYVVVYDVPVVFNVQRITDGWMFPFAWDANHPGRVGLIERAGDGTVDWIDMEQCMVSHDVGAVDTDSGVSLYATVSERIFDTDPAGPLETRPYLERIDIDVAGRSVRRDKVSDISVEFVRAHPDLWAAPARYLYAVGGGPGVSGAGVLEPGNRIVKFDTRTGTTDIAEMGAARATSEAVFVADPDRSQDEDGGWLLSYVYDATTDLSDLVVVDAQDMARGPIATVNLPGRVPFGFHGNWLPS